MILPPPSDRYDKHNEALARAALVAEDARNVKNTSFATTTKAGIVKPDGSTITVDRDGTIHAAAGTNVQLVASEDLAPGDIVNVHTVSGAARIRKANATDATKPAQGFVKVAVASGDAAAVFFGGQVNDAVSGLHPGALYYLDTAGGGLTGVALSANGNLDQEVGFAISASELMFWPTRGVLL
jgi:hypothetical protein